HEDHVGAVADHWPELRCPIYCTRFTAEILSRKLSEAELLGVAPVHIVETAERHSLGPFDIEWIALTHSTPESQALLIQTPVGKVFHTGDWKLDSDPVVGEPVDAAYYRAIGEQGITAMVCDSTNATVEGRSPSEGALYPGLLQKVKSATGRVVVACFGSNVARLTTLTRVALAANRHPGMLGRSLANYYRAARTAGLWTLEQTLIPAAHLGYLPRGEVFAIATGSQGEPGAALSRLAANNHPDLDLEAGDTVIFSSRIIPGNEQALESLHNRLTDIGVSVIHEQDSEAPIHASGHPAREELRDMYQWIKPSIAVPVHGESHHLDAHASLTKQIGVPTTLNGRNGDLYMLAPQPGLRRRAATVGRLLLQR
ncbi:MAG: ribonuclease J, partial [Pseudomonadota bacterium]